VLGGGGSIVNEPLILTWDDLDCDIRRMAKLAKPIGAKAIYGVPRGGLVVAVALSHLLDLPVVLYITKTVLIVDDVAETGRTLDRVHKRGSDLPPVVWCNKSDRDWIHVRRVEPDRWIIFPWESLEQAEADANAYYASRQRNL
jgi:hypoxanthine phosphoribosyltransferase